MGLGYCILCLRADPDHCIMITVYNAKPSLFARSTVFSGLGRLRVRCMI
jgi:hypothetical protein